MKNFKRCHFVQSIVSLYLQLFKVLLVHNLSKHHLFEDTVPKASFTQAEIVALCVRH